MKPSENELRGAVVAAGRRLSERGLVASTDGNISLRLGGGLFLVTPSGVPKGEMKEEDLCVVDAAGKVRYAPRRRPTTEALMHLKIYAERGDVNAVVHAHPPVATGFACAGMGLEEPIATEVILQLGKVPLAPYGTPGTAALPETLMCCIREFNGVLLANHGAVAWGAKLEHALGRMETIEQYAKITLVTRMLGKSVPLPPDEIERILAARGSYFG